MRGFWADGQLDVRRVGEEQCLWWDESYGRVLLDEASNACITQESTFQECESFWSYCHIQIQIPI